MSEVTFSKNICGLLATVTIDGRTYTWPCVDDAAGLAWARRLVRRLHV